MRGSSPNGGVGTLLERLDARTRSEMAAKREQAEAEVARIEQEAADARRLRRDDVLREITARVEADASAAVSAATLDARRELLEAQHALVDRVIVRATSELPSFVAAGRVTDALLAARVRSALKYVGGASPEIRCRPELARRLEAALPPMQLDARVVTDDGCGTGLVVSDGDGRLTIDDTLETRLARSATELAIEICRMAEQEGP